MFRKYQKGFSLLELLVVIVIIGIIATIVLAFMSGARQQSRDARRDRDTHELRTALGIYATDYDGRFPDTLDQLAPTYIPILPIDPLNQGNNTYQYVPENGNNSYVLTYCYEYSAPECKEIRP
ncbi:MAG TPA: prepilin-type N-terminal cleavage/methylation domain-containing protein [Candidatus Paceibacterota bacterium]